MPFLFDLPPAPAPAPDAPGVWTYAEPEAVTPLEDSLLVLPEAPRERGLLDRLASWWAGNVTLPLMLSPAGQAVGHELIEHAPDGNLLTYVQARTDRTLQEQHEAGRKAGEKAGDLLGALLAFLKRMGLWALVALAALVILFLFLRR